MNKLYQKKRDKLIIKKEGSNPPLKIKFNIY